MIIGTVGEMWRFPVKSMGGERLDHCTVGLTGLLGDRGWAVRDDIAGEIRGGRHFPPLLKCTARYREPPGEGRVPPVDITLPDGTHVGSDVPEVHARLSALVGQPVSLWPLQPASHKAHYRRAYAGARMMGQLSRSRLFRRVLRRILPYTSWEASARALLGREPDEPLPDFSLFPSALFEFTSPLGTYFDAFPLHLLTTASLSAMARLHPAGTWDVRRFRPNLLIATDDSLEGLVEAEWHGRTLRMGELAVQCEMPTARCRMTMQAQAGLPKDATVLRTIVREAGQQLGIYASVTHPGRMVLGDVVELP
jgi:MOSC domain-containing protein